MFNKNIDTHINNDDKVKMKNTYYNFVVVSERLHRLFLDTIKHELQLMKINDINNIQCLVLYNMGENEVNVGELTKWGYYLGSNVSYNLRKLVENGYVIQKRVYSDRRQTIVSLTQKGFDLRNKLNEVLSLHAEILSNEYYVNESHLEDITKAFKNIEKFLKGRN